MQPAVPRSCWTFSVALVFPSLLIVPRGGGGPWSIARIARVWPPPRACGQVRVVFSSRAAVAQSQHILHTIYRPLGSRRRHSYALAPQQVRDPATGLREDHPGQAPCYGRPSNCRRIGDSSFPNVSSFSNVASPRRPPVLRTPALWTPGRPTTVLYPIMTFCRSVPIDRQRQHHTISSNNIVFSQSSTYSHRSLFSRLKWF